MTGMLIYLGIASLMSYVLIGWMAGIIAIRFATEKHKGHEIEAMAWCMLAWPIVITVFPLVWIILRIFEAGITIGKAWRDKNNE